MTIKCVVSEITPKTTAGSGFDIDRPASRRHIVDVVAVGDQDHCSLSLHLQNRTLSILPTSFSFFLSDSILLYHVCLLRFSHCSFNLCFPGTFCQVYIVTFLSSQFRLQKVIIISVCCQRLCLIPFCSYLNLKY